MGRGAASSNGASGASSNGASGGDDGRAPGSEGIEEGEVRTALERVLHHADFDATDRLRAFLNYVVEEALAGREDRIRGRVIARQVFDRGPDFDPERDPVVRMEAAKLRRRLERYYLVAGDADPVRIEIPKGRYVPRFVRQNGLSGVNDEPAPSEDGRPSDRRPTVAVAPFTDLTGDPGRTFFGAGLVAELAHEMNRYERVAVVPYSPDGPDRSLGEARFLVEGSIRRDDVEMKIVVQLTDTATVRQVWSDSYKVPLEASRIISVQEDLAADLMAAVADEYGVISRRMARESSHKPPAELSSYEALLRYHYYLLSMTFEEGTETVEALTRTTEREPDYGPAWSALATLHVHAFLFDWPGYPDPLATAMRYARRGARLAPASQLSRTVLAYLHFLVGENAEFEREAERALALNPHSPNYVGTIGYLHAVAGDFERGEELLTQALDSGVAQPPWFYHGLFVIHFSRGEWEKAFHEVNRGFLVGFWEPALRAAALGKMGRLDEARAALDEVRRLKPDFEARVADLLTRTPVPEAVGAEMLDGLLKAGLALPTPGAGE